MLKYCNGCKRDLEIDKFYSYKKSICKQCVNKKVKCDYCEKEFNSTILSKIIIQIHSTYNTSHTNDNTYNTSHSSDSTSKKTNKNNSTSKKTNKSHSTSEITLSDRLYVSTFTDSLKVKHISYDQKDIDKINKILAINRKLNNKIEKDSINPKEKIQFANNLKKTKRFKLF